jgi:dipeptidase
MMTKSNIFKAAFKVMAVSAVVATTVDAEACTGLIATPGATATGSSIVTYAADSHVLYGELYSTPAADHAPGSKRKIIDWDTQKPLGEIDQVAHTYATVGNMNEFALTVTESTWGGHVELEGSGLLDYGSLIYITLERAKTAREAITVMTDLVAKYGYASEGESFTIADPQEVWILEMIGKGKTDPGAVWVARRVPDGYIAGHANHSRIHTFPLKDKTKETLYSKDVIDFARRQGYYTGADKDFDFSRAYADYDVLALRGCDARVWAFYNKFCAPGEMDAYIPWILEGKGDPLPLWVKPARAITADDMKWMMRDHFEGTVLDMTKDVGAGAFDCPYRWRPLTYKVDGQEYTHERAIATQQTGFSLVSDMNANRPEAMKGVLWFGVDDANTCAYIPVFNSNTKVPHEVAPGNGDMLTLSWDAMFWVNNYVANQAYNRYSQMIGDIRQVQSRLESAMTDDVNAAVKEVSGMDTAAAREKLNALTAKWAKTVTTDYKALGDKLLVKYLDGNIKTVNEDGSFKRTPYGVADTPKFGGYDERYYRTIVTEQGDHFKVNELE